MVFAGCVGAFRDRNTFVPGTETAIGSDLTDDPPIRDLVVQHDRVSPVEGLSLSAQSRNSGKDGADLLRPKYGLARSLVEDLPCSIDGFNNLGGASCQIVVRRNSLQRRAVGRIRNALEVEPNNRGNRRSQLSS